MWMARTYFLENIAKEEKRRYSVYSSVTPCLEMRARIPSREIIPAGRISPLFLLASEVPTIVPRCLRLLFWQQERMALPRWTGTISREADLSGTGGPLA
jgi:hypothetical protein